MNSNFIVRSLPLPLKVKAVTMPNIDGTFNIYLNSNLTEDQQFRAFLHEISHIKKGHFYKEIPVTSCEEEADSLASHILKNKDK